MADMGGFAAGSVSGSALTMSGDERVKYPAWDSRVVNGGAVVVLQIARRRQQ
jgi:hypothetical protein